MKKKIIIAASVLLVLAAVAAAVILLPKDKKPERYVSFIDVGQGDCILLSDGEKNVMVDCGTLDSGVKLSEYLDFKGIDSLDCLVLTHPHSDHCGGLGKVTAGVEVGLVLTNGEKSENNGYNSVLESLERTGVPVKSPACGEKYLFGDIELLFLGPAGDHKEENERSLVVMATLDGVKYLLMGDCSGEAETELVRKWEDGLRCDVLKVGHHGSSDATGEELLGAARPAFAVVSCGKNNDYGHPHTKTLERISAFDVRLFRTYDYMNALTFYAGDNDLKYIGE